jgi:hypothetical protein
MLLTLSRSTTEFWYLMVLLTLEIVNSRFQFTVRLLASLLKTPPKVFEAQSQGHACINSFHLFLFVYIVCSLKIGFRHMPINLGQYIQGGEIPTIIWVFFSLYETAALFKLRNCENIMVIGEKSHSILDRVFRVLALMVGLWFFYLGLCIPSSIFF